MATEQPIQLSTLIAGADLSAADTAAGFFSSTYRFITLDANGRGVLCTLGQAAVGVLQNHPASLRSIDYMAVGISRCRYGGTVTLGAGPVYLTSDANGQAVVATGTQAVNAIALEAGASGEIHSVLLTPRFQASQNSVLSFNMALASIANGAGPTNIFTFTPGFAGKIVSASAVVSTPATTGSKLATVTCGIGTTAVTNAASAGIALTSANCTPAGNEVKHAAITAANVFTASQTVTLIATAVTVFIEGSVTFLIVLG